MSNTSFWVQIPGSRTFVNLLQAFSIEQDLIKGVFNQQPQVILCDDYSSESPDEL
ncbi:hypothetical protein V5O48_019053, partial [Marasmius crinis-equi]